ncbi:MFS transporter [Pseudogulbenkiania sp. MAI-1]|uniref:MFS transporter n=1 Tax=Pseudogulbenkiania sp. MAI-1 TaxID=990370 RepID=UPI00045E8BDF|nr:MFS transporter [Pseudogulbenkiania sp. MAI-1]
MSSDALAVPRPTPVTFPAPASAPAHERLRAGTPAFRRTSWGMFFGGFATFSALYGPQPLMPMFSHDFGLSPAAASGVVSAATGALALALIPMSLLADRYGRKPVMNLSLGLAALLTLLAAFAHSFGQLLLLRTLMGIALAGIPAVAMAYLSEEIEPSSLGQSMGLYIAGNALGGMCGRFFLTLMSEWTGWREAVAVLGLFGLVSAVVFWRCLPESRHFRPARLALGEVRGNLRLHLSDDGLPWLFATAFLLMGCFVSLYNYLGYHLALAPFNLSPSAVGAVFLLYVVGMWSSAWVGRLADSLGRRNVLWIMVSLMLAGLMLTLAGSLWVVVPGIAVFTFGFFGAHSVASSWIGCRASRARGLASALYLSCYYLGGSGLGSASGLMWSWDGWSGVVLVLTAGLLSCLGIALRLRRLAPLPSAAG